MLDDPTQLPYGVASVVRNMRFLERSIQPRLPIAPALKFGAQGSNLNGLGAIRYLGTDNAGDEQMFFIGYTAQDGAIYTGSPMVQSSVQKLSLAQTGITQMPGLRPQIKQAYNRGILAMGDMETGVSFPLLVAPQPDGTVTIDQLSDKPVGIGWTAATKFRVGHIVLPTTPNGLVYRCTQAGVTAGVEPAWPVVTAGTVNDGGVIWQENTPQFGAGLPSPAAPTVAGITVDANSPIVAGAVVYAICTWSNQYGESTTSVTDAFGAYSGLKYTNGTGSAVDLRLTLPAIPPNIVAYGPDYQPTGVNLYVFISTGGPDDLDSLDQLFYGFAITGAPGSTVVVTAYPTGEAPPTVNNAYTTPDGNVPAGARYMIVLFKERNGYVTGVSNAFPISCTNSGDKRQLVANRIPIGPYNTIERICAFTVAGQSSAGPYFYIDVDDYLDPGLGLAKVKQTSTRILNNVDTGATFDFLDTFLAESTDVSNYFDRIEVPPCSDAYFSKSLNRVAYSGCQGYPSTILWSELTDGGGDPEAVRIPGGNCDVSPNDGDRLVCVRELKEIQVAYKENSAHSVSPNNGDPRTWSVNELWRGSGPVGPRAIDIGLAEDGTAFHVYAHRTGLWVYTSGAPKPIFKEIYPLWDRINWDRGPQIAVSINPMNREVRVHVPLDGSTENNCTLTMNYYFGWDDAIIFSVRANRLIPNSQGRKWSQDDSAANFSIYLDRRYLLNGQPNNGIGSYRQVVLYAGADGALYQTQETGYNDTNYDGTAKAFPWVWRGVPGANAKLAVMSLMGGTLGLRGTGTVNFTALAGDGRTYRLSRPDRPINFKPVTQETNVDFGARAFQSERFSFQIDNFAQDGVSGTLNSWAQVHIANLYMVPYLGARNA